MTAEITAYAILAFALIRFSVALTNHLSLLHLREFGQSGHPFVSVLVPARNEAANLPVLLDALSDQDYNNFEIIVYDDQSVDNTPKILERYAERNNRISWIKGDEVPGGWTGKNFACHNLAQKARGDLFLFLDADVRTGRNMLSKAVSYFSRYRLNLLSIFPHQVMKATGEWLTVPLMNWILLSLLPLILVGKSKRSSLAAANGQFMLFDAGVYRIHKWHEQVKHHLVEDIIINRMMKKKGYKTATLLGNNDVMCRMYSSFKEGANGFAKNVLEFFGGRIVTGILFTILVLPGVVIIPWAMNWVWLGIYIILIILIRILVSLTSRQSLQKNLLLHIPQMVTLLYIVILGIKVKLTGNYQWKGRNAGGKL